MESGGRIDQFGELATVWIMAILAGTLATLQRRALEHAAQMHEGALTSLVNALDARERNTRLHSQRVRAYAVRLAKQMGIRGSDATILGEAALLHDVGKIGVPDSILLKPGKLSDEEWTVMRRHPEFGFRILASVPRLGEAARIVFAHHERYDGTGYPNGLSGLSIPLGARIFSVVDVFDALTSDRPYHEALSIGKAIRAIDEKAGSDFDPEVVRAFKSIPAFEWRLMADSVNAPVTDNPRMCPPDTDQGSI
ncbi:MAG: HD-GYP domain-containing protein [Candidatus Hydrogenedentes bacterium]|nr:HD-GYP domain-containing protein [Candidatus Hydrogenedentota bacterium]